jgi:hypothetical protein
MTKLPFPQRVLLERTGSPKNFADIPIPLSAWLAPSLETFLLARYAVLAVKDRAAPKEPELILHICPFYLDTKQKRPKCGGVLGRCCRSVAGVQAALLTFDRFCYPSKPKPLNGRALGKWRKGWDSCPKTPFFVPFRLGLLCDTEPAFIQHRHYFAPARLLIVLLTRVGITWSQTTFLREFLARRTMALAPQYRASRS